MKDFYESFQPDGIYKPATNDHAMRAGNTLHVAGQLARDANGNLVAPGDVAAQARLGLRVEVEVIAVMRDEVSSTEEMTVVQREITLYGLKNLNNQRIRGILDPPMNN